MPQMLEAVRLAVTGRGTCGVEASIEEPGPPSYSFRRCGQPVARGILTSGNIGDCCGHGGYQEESGNSPQDELHGVTRLVFSIVPVIYIDLRDCLPLRRHPPIKTNLPR